MPSRPVAALARRCRSLRAQAMPLRTSDSTAQKKITTASTAQVPLMASSTISNAVMPLSSQRSRGVGPTFGGAQNHTMRTNTDTSSETSRPTPLCQTKGKRLSPALSAAR